MLTPTQMFTPAQIDGKIAQKYPANLIFCDSESLLFIAKNSQSKTCRANCLAELLIRLYLNEEETLQTEDGKPKLRDQVERILSHGEVSCFLQIVKQLRPFKPDHANQLVLWREDADALSLACRLALEKRLRILFHADGVIPVQKDGKGWMIPFDLQDKDKSQYAVSDLDGNVIDEWNNSVSELDIAPYGVRVHCSAKEMGSDSPFIGRSLMLPVWAAYLKKERKVPHYDPFKFILSGAFEQDGRLSEFLGITGKAAGLAEHYPDAIFLIPEKTDVSGLDDESARIINIHTLPNDKKELLTPYIEQEVEKFSEEAELNRKIEAYYKKLEKDSQKKPKVINALSSYTLLYASGIIPAEDSDKSPKAPQDYSPFDDEEDDDIEEDDVEIPDKKMDGEERSDDLLTLMKEISPIVILGEPGSGKTTTLSYYVMYCHKPAELAVLISLGKRSKYKDLWGYKSLWEMIREATKLSPEELRKLIETKRLRLVLDALNEYPDVFRKGLVGEIRSTLQEHPDLRIAVSARTDEDLRCLRLPTFTVQPMNAKQQLNYLTFYLKDEEKAQSLLNRLLARPGGTEIASNPLLLWMVYDVFNETGELQEGRAALYRRWIKLWYEREEKKSKNAKDPLPWDLEQACRIFSALAFQSRSKGENGEVSAETVEPFFRKYGKRNIEKLCQGPVIALTEEENSILFRHETFQEFFCAEYLIVHPDDLPQHLTKDDSARWGMPLAYAAELQWPLPKPLLRAAWEIDPWFGFSVTDGTQLTDAAEYVSKQTNLFLPQILSNCTLPPEKDSFISPAEMAAKCNNYWYSCNDPKLGYIVLTNEMIKKRWLGMELSMLRKEYTPRVLCFVLTRSIVLKQYANAGQSIHKTFQKLLEAGKDLASSSLEEHLRSVEEKLLTDEYLLGGTQRIQDGFA